MVEQQPYSDSPAMYAFRRVRDTAEDVDIDDDAGAEELAAAVRLHAGELDRTELFDLVVLLTAGWSKQFVRPRRDDRSADDGEAADRASRAVIIAAQHYVDAESFTAAVEVATDGLSRRQVVRVAALLATHLSAVVGADPLTDAGQEIVDGFARWLDRR